MFGRILRTVKPVSIFARNKHFRNYSSGNVAYPSQSPFITLTAMNKPVVLEAKDSVVYRADGRDVSHIENLGGFKSRGKEAKVSIHPFCSLTKYISTSLSPEIVRFISAEHDPFLYRVLIPEIHVPICALPIVKCDFELEIASTNTIPYEEILSWSQHDWCTRWPNVSMIDNARFRQGFSRNYAIGIASIDEDESQNIQASMRREKLDDGFFLSYEAAKQCAAVLKEQAEEYKTPTDKMFYAARLSTSAICTALKITPKTDLNDEVVVAYIADKYNECQVELGRMQSTVTIHQSEVVSQGSVLQPK